jgi:short-subunit dehydrogenase
MENIMSPTNATGKALITGASSGIGAAYAERLARRGYDLILVARDEARLAALASRIHKDDGVQVEVVRADLTQRDDLAKVVQQLRNDSSITMLVNNAGTAVFGTLASHNSAALDTMIDLNVRAMTHLASAAASSFVTQGRGTVINIASVLALAPEMSGAVYGGTKAYTLNLSMTLNQEVSASGVRVQAVLPGVTRTEIWDRSGHDLANIPPAMIMEVADMVDAALAGLDQGELITIPALPDVADLEAYTAARLHLAPNLSRDHAATRYTTVAD